MTVRLGLLDRLALARLLLITDIRDGGDELSALATAALGGGVGIIQVRDASANVEELLTALDLLHNLAAGYAKALVSAYGDPGLLAAANPDVLQLSAVGPAAAAARKRLHRWALVGRSCHSAAQVDAAVAEDDVAFFTVSPVFNTGGTGEAGLALVTHAAGVAGPGGKPWFAVGGINLDNIEAVIAAGARRVGVTRAIASAKDPGAAATALADRLRQADPPPTGEIRYRIGS